MKKIDNNKKVMIVVTTFVLILLAVATTSYALVQFKKEGKTENTIRTGTLILNLDETKELSLTSAYPMSDSQGMASSAYEFTVENTGTQDAKYKITLVDDTKTYTDDACSKLEWSKLKYSIVRNGVTITSARYLSNIATDSKLDEIVIAAGNKNSYQLRIWIDSSAGNEIVGKHFHAKLNIKGILSDKSDYDTGA